MNEGLTLRLRMSWRRMLMRLGANLKTLIFSTHENEW